MEDWGGFLPYLLALRSLQLLDLAAGVLVGLLMGRLEDFLRMYQNLGGNLNVLCRFCTLGRTVLLHGVTCKSMEEISGTDYWNALIGFNSTQMLITGNNDICLSLSGTGQDMIIGGIVFDDVGNDFRRDNFCHSRKAFCPGCDLALGPLEFLPEDVGELGYDSRRYEEGVGSFEGMFPNESHFSVREVEGRSIDIRI